MIRLATTKAIGEITLPPGRRYGRSWFGSRSRNTPKASGAPAYIRTLAEVMKETSSCQLGKGRKQITPVTNEMIRPNHGTPRLSVFSNARGA